MKLSSTKRYGVKDAGCPVLFLTANSKPLIWLWRALGTALSFEKESACLIGKNISWWL